MAEARFLAAADLHLGRPIASLPEALGDSARTLGPYGALERLVERAREERVHAVLLAGDVVDDDGAYFEVLSALQDAARRLEGVPLLAIAGNHDAGVLPRLAQAIEGLTLLGAGGRWASHLLPTPAGEVEVLGWSFPRSHWPQSPFDTPPPPRKGRRIGLLHGDLDAASSVYAPFTSAQLRDYPADVWLLGHVHAPSPQGLGPRAPWGYLGSACGLDPTEAGPRGAWLVRCGTGGVSAEHVELAPIAWASVRIDADQLATEGLDAALHRHACEAADDFEHARAVGVRLTLAGEHERWKEIDKQARTEDLGQPWEHNGKSVFLDKVTCRLSAPMPLERLAQERTAAGRVAGLILALQGDGARELVEDATEAFEKLAGDRNLRVPTDGERSRPPPDARLVLLDGARQVLSELLSQDEGRG